jgi:hypothetical protein
MKKYIDLKNYKKAYVVCAVGQSYIDSTEGMIRALSNFSKYPVILYYSDGVVKYEYDNLIKQPFRSNNIKVESEHSLKLLTTLKAEVTLNSIKRYDVDCVVMLDSDIIVTPKIDNVFDTYENIIENYPIFIKYSWDIITVMGRPLVSDYIQNSIGVEPAKIPAVCSCMCIANKNCVSFLEDWRYWCENSDLIKHHYVDNKDIYFDFNDESIVNALLWKYGATKILPTNLQWAWKYDSVKFSLDFYDGKVAELQRHGSLYNSHWKIPENYEVPYGLSVIPLHKNDLWGFHGPKDINEINLIIDEIKNRF